MTALETRPLHPLFGVEIVGVDVNRVDAGLFPRIVDAFEALGASHACEIVGMPTDAARALIRDLLDRAPAPELVYMHRWRPGDLVMWDNRCLLHRGRPWDGSRDRRVMHRTTVAGEGPTAGEVADIRVAPARDSDVAWCRAQLDAIS